MMSSNIRHSSRPLLMPCWFDGSNSLDALPMSIDPTTAPHDCMMPGCPGPVNKRKLEAFEELLAALEGLHKEMTAVPAKAWLHLDAEVGEAIDRALETAWAAIAKATGPQARLGYLSRSEVLE